MAGAVSQSRVGCRLGMSSWDQHGGVPTSSIACETHTRDAHLSAQRVRVAIAEHDLGRLLKSGSRDTERSPRRLRGVRDRPRHRVRCRACVREPSTLPTQRAASRCIVREGAGGSGISRTRPMSPNLFNCFWVDGIALSDGRATATTQHGTRPSRTRATWTSARLARSRAETQTPPGRRHTPDAHRAGVASRTPRPATPATTRGET